MTQEPTNQQDTTPMPTGFANGHVVHNRLKPKPHKFKYNMCWGLFDLDRLDLWFGKSKLWGHNRWSLFSLYDTDYVNAEKQPIKQKLKHYIQQQTNHEFNGKVLLFTHPKFLGYGFNSVNFYFCYQQLNGIESMRYIVSEINNTPWGEKHLYLHDCKTAENTDKGLSFKFEKKFHISPFVSMDMNYCWAFKLSAEKIVVYMWVKKQQQTILTVALDTKITPLMDNNINSYLLKKPFQPWKMSLGIYWQAFKLWLKKTPVYDHPK